MKKILLTIIAMSFIGTCTYANTYNSVDCDSTRGTGNTLRLEIVNNQDIFMARLNNMRTIIVHKLANQNIDGITLYTVSGMDSLMEVESEIFTSGQGHISLNGEDFSCN